MTTMEDLFNLREGAMIGEGPAARRAAVAADPRRRLAVREAKALYLKAMSGDRRATNTVNEAITASDLFRDALGQVMDVEMLQQYQTAEKQWTKIATPTKVRNFKPKAMRTLVGTNYALPRVPERTGYPVAEGLDRHDQFVKVNKFGELYGYTLEARLNDDIGELQETPAQWAGVAARTEDDAVLEALVNALTGAPNPAFFNQSNGNVGTGLLTADNLQAAYETVTTRRDSSGRLLTAPRLQLVVGPGLMFTAQRILNTTQIRRTDASGAVVYESNPFAGKFDLVVLANLVGGAWFLLPVPSSPRPAVYAVSLTGFETPDLRYKANAGNSLGGGSLGADSGSFEDDTVWYRVRHIFGGALGDPMFTYASDGQDTGGAHLTLSDATENDGSGGSSSDAAKTGKTEQEAAQFDPSEHNQEDVVAHLKASDATEVARVKAAEAEGKNRQKIAEFEPDSSEQK